MIMVVKARPSGAVTVYVMTTSVVTGADGVNETSVEPEDTVVVNVMIDGAGVAGVITAGAVAVIVITSGVAPSPPGNVTVKIVTL